MTDLALSLDQQPSPAAPQPARKLKVTGKVKVALDFMVWDGLKRQDAAERAGLKDNSLYVALTRPDVKAYYLRQLDVLRTSERARNIHALAEVREGDNQMARVAAVKALEQISDETPSGSRGSVQLPGLTIQIVNALPVKEQLTPIKQLPNDINGQGDE